MSKDYTTISIKDEVLEELKNLDITIQGFKLKFNNDKIKYLIDFYKNNK